jgi:hypothetical protein
VFQEFRARFIGKCSPVHFFWGSFDLAVTRFSGRPAPAHPGGIPNLPDWVTREAWQAVDQEHGLEQAGVVLGRVRFQPSARASCGIASRTTASLAQAGTPCGE